MVFQQNLSTPISLPENVVWPWSGLPILTFGNHSKFRPVQPWCGGWRALATALRGRISTAG